MSRHYIVSYDLHTDCREEIIEKLKELGVTMNLQQSVWYLNSQKSTPDILKALEPLIDKKDSLFVAHIDYFTSKYLKIEESQSSKVYTLLSKDFKHCMYSTTFF